MTSLGQITIFGISAWNWLSWLWLSYGVVLAVWIVLQKRSPVSTLAWIMVLMLLPLLGLAVYAYFGPQRIRRARLKRWLSKAALLSDRELDALRQDRPDPPIWAVQHARLIEQSCGLPMSSCWDVELLASGGATLDALLAAIGAAREHLHLEYYIFDIDTTGHAILKALTAKAAQGVRVRLLVDAVGSPRMAGRQGRRELAAFSAAGGEFAVFHPARFDRFRPLVNLRTHRKIVVCDGKVGFLGGINVTDDENERVRPDSAYRDTHLRLSGGAVRWLQYLFLQDWSYANGGEPAAGAMLPEQVAAGTQPVQIVASGPDNDGEAIHRAMIDAIGLARERIWLATPYFVPTEPALAALTNAALRGVQVKLMVPERSDSRVVSAAARSYFAEMQKAGVLVFEYQGRMFHAKTLLVDQQYGMVGSANFDSRSFRLNFEVAAVVLGRSFNEQLARMFDRDLSACRLVPAKRRLRFDQKLFEAGARLFSPLL
ncbi:cardiolipin synthase [Ottowia sp.]|uniref:cardiolipin synthase n=1 Tax=Ottowia sp. TaxID=1898956 RepID=UPI00260D541E|nr:cardiolipin synthase [Ottowia sp.]